PDERALARQRGGPGPLVHALRDPQKIRPLEPLFRVHHGGEEAAVAPDLAELQIRRDGAGPVVDRPGDGHGAGNAHASIQSAEYTPWELRVQIWLHGEAEDGQARKNSKRRVRRSAA